MSIENIWEEKGVYRKCCDCINRMELIQATEEVHSHSLFDDFRYIINDFLDVTEHDVTSADVVALAEVDRVIALTNPNIKVAIVATMETIKILASLYEDLTSRSPYTTKIFTNIDEARAWVHQ